MNVIRPRRSYELIGMSDYGKRNLNKRTGKNRFPQKLPRGELQNSMGDSGPFQLSNSAMARPPKGTEFLYGRMWLQKKKGGFRKTVRFAQSSPCSTKKEGMQRLRHTIADQITYVAFLKKPQTPDDENTISSLNVLKPGSRQGHIRVTPYLLKRLPDVSGLIGFPLHA